MVESINPKWLRRGSVNKSQPYIFSLIDYRPHFENYKQLEKTLFYM